jgi:hypothetical protein
MKLVEPELLDRALTVRQPYADMILRGEKRYEYRKRATRLRERVYIYTPRRGPASPTPAGMLVGSVAIVACAECPDGTFAWELDEPVRFADPMFPKGKPGGGLWPLAWAKEKRR